MNLPDYKRCVDFMRLHVAMGIREIPTVLPIALEEAVALQQIRELPDPEDAATDLHLHRDAISIWKQDVVDLPNEPLIFRGRQVCVYVRDQQDSVAFGGAWRRYAYHALIIVVPYNALKHQTVEQTCLRHGGQMACLKCTVGHKRHCRVWIYAQIVGRF